MLYEPYEVEVRCTSYTVTQIRAKNPLSAAKIADDPSHSLPPATRWKTVTNGWEYIVRDLSSKEVLYRGHAQELS
jgi:hypothetical protein